MQNIDIFLDNMKRFTQEHQSTWEERKIQKLEQQVVRLKEKLDTTLYQSSISFMMFIAKSLTRSQLVNSCDVSMLVGPLVKNIINLIINLS